MPLTRISNHWEIIKRSERFINVNFLTIDTTENHTYILCHQTVPSKSSPNAANKHEFVSILDFRTVLDLFAPFLTFIEGSTSSTHTYLQVFSNKCVVSEISSTSPSESVRFSTNFSGFLLEVFDSSKRTNTQVAITRSEVTPWNQSQSGYILESGKTEHTKQMDCFLSRSIVR